ncbi:DUF397 domain-containing protein [Streptomyces albidoflavus]|uniref:DUF397 domain-containing protein n=1 Tax=Streptomyces sp. B29(2018) TaxID=2485016 RepID=UPI0027D334AE|nr:DUF397 domain-containing protein [Streptomyces sp. B29(2018)]
MITNPNHLTWTKSSYSEGTGNSCIEMAQGNLVHLRDSKDTAIPGFAVSGDAWETFLGSVAK